MRTATGWPGRTAGGQEEPSGLSRFPQTETAAARQRHEPQRLVALDHPHQVPIDSSGLRHATYARVDLTHELPIVIHDRDGEVMARFASPADAAFYLTGRLSLPAELLAALELDSDG